MELANVHPQIKGEKLFPLRFCNKRTVICPWTESTIFSPWYPGTELFSDRVIWDDVHIAAIPSLESTIAWHPLAAGSKASTPAALWCDLVSVLVFCVTTFLCVIIHATHRTCSHCTDIRTLHKTVPHQDYEWLIDWWSLIQRYSPLSWADSLRLYVALREWLAFIARFCCCCFFEYPPKWCT